MDGILPDIREGCDNRQFCVAVANVEEDPCPSVAKYLEIVYSCEQKGELFFSCFDLFLFFQIQPLRLLEYNRTHLGWKNSS